MDSELIDEGNYWSGESPKKGGRWVILAILAIVIVGSVFIGLNTEGPFGMPGRTVANKPDVTVPDESTSGTRVTSSTTTLSSTATVTTTSTTTTTTTSTIIIDSCMNLCLSEGNDAGKCIDEPVHCTGNKIYWEKGGDKFCSSKSKKYDTCCCFE